MKHPETSNSGEQLAPEGLGRQPGRESMRAEVLGEGHLTGAVAFPGGCNLTPQEGSQVTNPQPLSSCPPSAASHWLNQPEARGPGELM